MRMLKVLVASRSQVSVGRLSACLSKYDEYEVTTRVINNGHEDPLYGVTRMPDLLLFHPGPGASELTYLAENGVRDQLPLIVFGKADDTEAMRQAMRAGARDYLSDNASEAELIASVVRVHEDLLRTRTADISKLVVVINGKGGSGASFLATNIAHSLVVDHDARVTLIDLDLQFGGLYRYLDMKPTVGILQALELSHELDEVSANAFTCEHASGLRMLAAPSKYLTMADSVSVDKLESVLNAYLSLNDYLVADAPAKLDAVTELFLARADKILLVTQQSLPHIQDSARQLQLLTNEFGISKKRISVVVNRWTKNSEIIADDIRKAIRVDKLLMIPNNYKIANESINTGVPVAEISKTAALTKGIRALNDVIADPTSRPDPGFLKRVMPNFLGG